MPPQASDDVKAKVPEWESDRPSEEPVGEIPRDEPTAWWIKLLVWAIVAALCLAFAGLVWALAL